MRGAIRLACWMLSPSSLACEPETRRGYDANSRLQQLTGEKAPGKLLVVEILLRDVGFRLVVLVEIENFGVAG